MTIIDINLPTLVTLQWRIYDASGAPIPGGLFTATLTDDAAANNANVVDSTVSGYFDASGRLVADNGLAFQLLTNDTTTPSVAYYDFVAVIPGSGRREFRAVLSRQATFTDVDAEAVVAADLVTVTLTNLVVSAVMVSQSITGSDISSGTTVASVNAVANTLTLSKPAVAASSATAVTIGGTLNIQSLLSSVA